MFSVAWRDILADCRIASPPISKCGIAVRAFLALATNL
jgi:hypothetical protein